MFEAFKNKITSFIKSFNDSLNYDDNEIEEYLSKNGVFNKKESICQSEKDELINKELSFEKNSGYVFHIFRVNYGSDSLKNESETLKFVKTCSSVKSFKEFLQKIDFSDLYEIKTKYKWNSNSYPIYYLDYLNKPESALIETEKNIFLKLDPINTVFITGLKQYRMTIPDFKTCLRELNITNNDGLGNGFLIFVSKNFNSLELKKEILKKELEKIEKEISSLKENSLIMTKENLINILKSDDNKKSLKNENIVHKAIDAKQKIKNELLILNKIEK